MPTGVGGGGSKTGWESLGNGGAMNWGGGGGGGGGVGHKFEGLGNDRLKFSCLENGRGARRESGKVANFRNPFEKSNEIRRISQPFKISCDFSYELWISLLQKISTTCKNKHRKIQIKSRKIN